MWDYIWDQQANTCIGMYVYMKATVRSLQLKVFEVFDTIALALPHFDTVTLSANAEDRWQRLGWTSGHSSNSCVLNQIRTYICKWYYYFILYLLTWQTPPTTLKMFQWSTLRSVILQNHRFFVYVMLLFF